MSVINSHSSNDVLRYWAFEMRRSPAVSYYEGAPGASSWKTAGGGDVTLVELWEPGHPPQVQKNRPITLHKARNPFFPVTDIGQKEAWHRLVEVLLQGGFAARDVRGVNKPAPPKGSPKVVVLPPWARKDRVIGYTSTRLRSPSTVSGELIGEFEEAIRRNQDPDVWFPSVYYSTATPPWTTRCSTTWGSRTSRLTPACSSETSPDR